MKIVTDFKEINNIAKEIGKIKNVKAVYLFGSYATEKHHALSDIDLCVIGDLTEKEEYKILGYGSDNFDISPFNRLPISIRFRVFKEGKPLLINDKEYIRLLRIKTLRDYLDFKWIINKYIRETLNVQP